MGCGNSTATSGGASRGKRCRGAWVPRERLPQRGGVQIIAPSPFSRLERFWKDRVGAGAPCGGGHARIQRGGLSPGSCSRALHPSGDQNFPDTSRVPHLPFQWGAFRPRPLPRPNPFAPRPCTWKSAAEQVRTFLGLGVGPSARGFRAAAGGAPETHPCGVGLLT